MPGPKVTIAIPTRNRADFLIGAVTSALKQTYENIEVIVSDNASTDNTVKRVQKINDRRLIILEQKTNIGQGGNFNACLKKASGEFFILLPDDDFLEPTAVENLIRPFVNGLGEQNIHRETIGMVYGQTRYVDEHKQIIGYTKHAPVVEDALEMIVKNFTGLREIFPSSLIVRTADVIEQGGFDYDRYSIALDAAMWINVILRRRNVVFLPRVISNYTVHKTNITSEAKISEWEFADTALIETCIQFFKEHGDKEAVRKLRKAGEKFLSRKVASLISLTVRKGGSRLNAFRLTMLYNRYFTNLYGFYILLFNLTKVFLPAHLFYKIKKLISPAAFEQHVSS